MRPEGTESTPVGVLLSRALVGPVPECPVQETTDGRGVERGRPTTQVSENLGSPGLPCLPVRRVSPRPYTGSSVRCRS